MTDPRTQADHRMSITQSHAMKLWRERDDDGRYWLMEELRCEACALQAENERLRAAIRTFLSHVPLDENAASLLGVPIGPLAAALQEEDTE